MQGNESSENNQKRKIWYAHIEQWKASKLKQKAYCAQAGIKYNTFVYWRGQFLLELKPETPVALASVKIEKTPMLESIKIRLLSGYTMVLPGNMDVRQIAKLIHLLDSQDA